MSVASASSSASSQFCYLKKEKLIKLCVSGQLIQDEAAGKQLRVPALKTKLYLGSHESTRGHAVAEAQFGQVVDAKVDVIVCAIRQNTSANRHGDLEGLLKHELLTYYAEVLHEMVTNINKAPVDVDNLQSQAENRFAGPAPPADEEAATDEGSVAVDGGSSGCAAPSEVSGSAASGQADTPLEAMHGNGPRAPSQAPRRTQKAKRRYYSRPSSLSSLGARPPSKRARATEGGGSVAAELPSGGILGALDDEQRLARHIGTHVLQLLTNDAVIKNFLVERFQNAGVREAFLKEEKARLEQVLEQSRREVTQLQGTINDLDGEMDELRLHAEGWQSQCLKAKQDLSVFKISTLRAIDELRMTHTASVDLLDQLKAKIDG